MVCPTDTQAEPRLAPPSFSEFTCEIVFEIYTELLGEGNHCDESCTYLQNNGMMYVKFRICCLRGTYSLSTLSVKDGPCPAVG